MEDNLEKKIKRKKGRKKKIKWKEWKIDSRKKKDSDMK